MDRSERCVCRLLLDFDAEESGQAFNDVDDDEGLNTDSLRNVCR